MDAEKEKKLVDVLSYLETHSGVGVNEIGRFLATKGYAPLHKGGHYSGSKMLHPCTTMSILKNAAAEGLVTSKFPFGDQKNKGKTNRIKLTSKGKKFLVKKSMIRFIESSDVKDITIPLVSFQKSLLKAEEELDDAAIRMSSPLGPGDKLTDEEERFFVKENTKIKARKLLASWQIKLIIPDEAKSIQFTDSELQDFCMLMAGYDNLKRAFSVVISYDPFYYDLDKNQLLRKDLNDIMLQGFFSWLTTFKGISESDLAKNKELFEALLVEYRSKAEKSDRLMDEIRDYADKYQNDIESIKEFAESPIGKELLQKFRMFFNGKKNNEEKIE